MSQDEITRRLDALALRWANGEHFRDVLLEAWSDGYGEGYSDGERSL